MEYCPKHKWTEDVLYLKHEGKLQPFCRGCFENGEKPVPLKKKVYFRPPASKGVMSDGELEFIKAIEDYKRENNVKFPTWSEVLTVVKRLGYHK